MINNWHAIACIHVNGIKVLIREPNSGGNLDAVWLNPS
ncbi:hypothetical protein MHIR_DE00297 [Candidatus Doolittlea endobia]|uniref:Uncharacterized protein n=1 Tax=Candidatus Doolittlea endobia TaxID=1778262 RepID=A0A143WSM6_9ENTR|nr:hypothetical protein MHIR_DE00297 [Candidatus Doolittlea endobia]